jgi:hypothetical protein
MLESLSLSSEEENEEEVVKEEEPNHIERVCHDRHFYFYLSLV